MIRQDLDEFGRVGSTISADMAGQRLMNAIDTLYDA